MSAVPAFSRAQRSHPPAVVGFGLVLAILALLGATLLAPAVGAATARVAGATPIPRAVVTDVPKGYILVDADTGRVITGSAEHVPRLTASTIKLLTALTFVETVPLDSTLTVSPRAASMPASRINMQAGQVWPVRNALESMLLVSANDAAYALAERAAGSAEAFGKLATATGHRLGMRDTTVGDPAGLDDQGGRSTASPYDLAVAARNVLAVPELAGLVGTAKASFVDPAGQTRYLTNHNALLTSRPYAGVTGMKTGFTTASGRTFVGTATRDGRTMIVVVMDVIDQYGWATRLLDQGFATPVAQESATAERLPAPSALPESTRALIAAGIPSVLGAPRMLATGATAIATTTSAATTSAATTSAATTASSAASAAATTVAAGHGSDSGIGVLEWVLILLALLTVAFFARRAQIKARRRRRLQARRAAALARRGVSAGDHRATGSRPHRSDGHRGTATRHRPPPAPRPRSNTGAMRTARSDANDDA